MRLVARGFAILGSGKLCYACNKRVGRFLPYRGGWKDVPPLIQVLDVIGSDVENFSCPRCGAHDRERHLLMYFDYAEIWQKIERANVLHFAPEPILAAKISNARPARYIKADLFPAAPEVTQEDITKLSFGDCTFDKPGGLAVLQTPYSDKLTNTFEDEGICEEEARLQAFGQEDHVRLYGKDLFSRLGSVGFVPRVLRHDVALKNYGESFYGVNRREPFICMSRPAAV